MHLDINTISKKILIFPVLIMLLNPAQIFAISATDLKSVLYDTVMYQPGSGSANDCLASGPGGSGPLLGPHFPKISDKADLATRLTNYIKDNQPSSPMLEHVNELITLGEQYDVSPAMAIAFATQETSLGTAGWGKPPQNNIFNIRGDGAHGFKNYPNISGSITDYYKLLSGSLYLGEPSNFTDIDTILNRYAPPVENDTNHYAEVVKSIMKKVLDGMSTEAGAAPASSSNPSCGSVNEEGLIGWSFNGSNAMAHYYQCDSKWGDSPYGYEPNGSPKSSICSGGCGITSSAMVVATLTGDKTITPKTLSDKYGNRYHTSGTDHGLFPVLAQDYNLHEQELNGDTEGLKSAAQIIKDGGLVIVGVDPGPFTSQGHLMVIRATSQDGTQFYLANPTGDKEAYSTTETTGYTAEYLLGEGNLRHMWAFTK